MKGHQQSVHKNKKIQCVKCDFRTTNEHILNIHMNVSIAHKSEKECRFFKFNGCRLGDSCKYKHDNSEILQVRKPIPQTSQCKDYGLCQKFPDCDNDHYEICKFQDKCRNINSCKYVHLRQAVFLDFLKNTKRYP